MAITKLMSEITAAYDNGASISNLAEQYNISAGSVRKKIQKVHRYKNALNPQADIVPESKLTRKPRGWTVDTIKVGIERYIAEQGVMPTSRDFDETDYLPSARQIQRAHGGLVELRRILGYEDVDFTKGELRKTIAMNANKRGLSAEDYFEPLLIEKFGEPYVHVQKRYYKGSKCRYDFLVYSRNSAFGIDVFTTDRANYIEKNIRHKILRYKNAPSDLLIYFVLVGNEFTATDVATAAASIGELKYHPNMKALHEFEFIELLNGYRALDMPQGFIGLEILELASNKTK